MAHFIPKKYQQDPASGGGVLDSVEAYFKACHQHGRASLAFTAVTEDLWGKGLPYRPLKDFSPGMPYFCLRVPHSVVLWPAPSKTIRDQTANTRSMPLCGRPGRSRC